MKQSTYLGVLLVVSALLLTSLVPGGLVENRDFSHINTMVLVAFNMYLTVLALGSFVVGVGCLRHSTSVFATLAAGVSYVLVYALDLLQIFPVSPTPMSHALWAIEVAGLLLALPLVGLSAFQLSQPQTTLHQQRVIPWHWLLPVGMVVVIYASVVTICGY